MDPSQFGFDYSQFESQQDAAGKLEKAKLEKEKGNENIGKGLYSEALVSYHISKMYVKGLMNVPPEIAEGIKSLELSVNLNMAQAYLKLSKWEKVIEVTTLVLNVDPKNVKALYRRGKAYLELRKTDDARTDLVQAVKLSPNDKIIRDEYARLLVVEKEQDSEGAAIFKNIFGTSSKK